MKTNKTMLKRGTYRHYRRLPDGTEVYLGEVDYTYLAEVTERDADFDRERLEDERERRERERDDFEALADAACDAD